MIQVYDRGAYLIGECPCGEFGKIIGSSDEEPLPAITIAVNLGDLLEHARGCGRANSATEQLVDKLMRERYGLPARSATR
jgi:hypothetical protein